jgi:hypothetical protein
VSFLTRPAETIASEPTTPPADLIPLSHLVLEGLAENVTAGVVLDDIGRRCVTREAARHLMTEHAEALARQEDARRRQQERLDSEQQKRLSAVLPGVAVPPGLEDLSALEVMLAETAREKVDSASTVLEDYMSGESRYHPLPQGEQ